MRSTNESRNGKPFVDRLIDTATPMDAAFIALAVWTVAAYMVFG